MPRLEKWNIGHNGRLVGLIYDDEAKRFPDGLEVQTSTVVAYDPKERIATTRSGTHYALDEKGPHQEMLSVLKNLN